MARYKIVVSPLAQRDMIEIAAYIANDLQEPELALKIIARFEDAMHALGEMPRRHPLLKNPRLAKLGARMLVVQGYMLFYGVDEAQKQVNVFRVLYRRRDWASLLMP